MKISNCRILKRFGAALSGIVLFWVAASSPPAIRAETLSGEGGGKKEKIYISSESLVANDSEKFAEFIGKVKAVQGNTEILSDRLKIYYEGNPRKSSSEPTQKAETARDSIKKIVAVGNVRITFDDTVAESREAVYTTSDRILVLSGPNAKVTKASSGEISGSKISINRESGQIKFEGDVEGVFFPGEGDLN